MRYIKVETRLGMSFFFCTLGSHKDLEAKHGKALSAGFYNPKTGETYGFSSGLKLKPDPEDAELIKMASEVLLESNS